MQVFWFIPTHGDSRYLGTSEGAREVNHDYLKQIAQATALSVAGTQRVQNDLDVVRPS